jgi:hypothetical protein
MAYRVWIGNVPIDCETAADAVELAKQAEGIAIPAKKPVGAKPLDLTGGEQSRWTERRAKDFFGLLKTSQKKLIDTLLENEEGKTDKQLCGILSIDGGKALGGVMAATAKNVKKVGADSKDFFVKKRVSINGGRETEYFLNDAFRKAASQVRK